MTSCPPILILTADDALVAFLQQDYCGPVTSSTTFDGTLVSQTALILVDRDLVLLELVQQQSTARVVFIQSESMPLDAGVSDSVYAVLRWPLTKHITGHLLQRLAVATMPALNADNGVENDDLLGQQALEMILRKEEDLNQQKYRFMTMVAHEFRTPLTIISSASEMMEHFWKQLSEAEEKSYLDKIRETVLHLKRVLTQIEGVIHTNFQTLVFFPTEFDLIALCDEIIQRVTHRMKASPKRIVFTTHDIPPRVRLDREKVGIIVEQLLLNALKFSAADAPVLLTLSMDTHNLVIRVQDEGIGIPADETEQIYELFYQGSNIGAIGGKGRGMGLKFVRDSVRAHDGKIEVQSALNKGTTFTVTLSPQPIKRIQ